MSNPTDRRFMFGARGLPADDTIDSGVEQNFTTFASNQPSDNGGTPLFSDSGNVEESDDSVASCVCTSVTTKYLYARDLATIIPSDATVDGITIRIERSIALGTVIDAEIKIVKTGNVSTTNKSAGATWPGSDTYASFGGAADKWGETWTAAEINRNDFGFVLACTGTGGAFDIATVDHIAVTIDYS